MTSLHARILITLLIIGLLSACGTQATDTPASQPTEPVAPPTQAVANTSAPTDTAIPASSPASPTEAPTEVPPTQASSQGVTVSFTNDVLPIFNNRCANCHGGNRTEEGLILLTYADILKGSDNGPVIVAGNADGSFLVEQVVSQEMPKRGPKLTPPQIQLIVDWINQGALEN
jgi:mono/diheme cytochrome c family protein